MGDSDGGDAMERLTRLETHFEYVQRDLGEIKGTLKDMAAVLSGLSTRDEIASLRRDLWAWKWQWTALALAVVAITIGGIIGGLDWIKPEPTPPVPIVIQAPSAPPGGVAPAP